MRAADCRCWLTACVLVLSTWGGWRDAEPVIPALLAMHATTSDQTTSPGEQSVPRAAKGVVTAIGPQVIITLDDDTRMAAVWPLGGLGPRAPST